MFSLYAVLLFARYSCTFNTKVFGGDEVLTAFKAFANQKQNSVALQKLYKSRVTTISFHVLIIYNRILKMELISTVKSKENSCYATLFYPQSTDHPTDAGFRFVFLLDFMKKNVYSTS